MASRVKDWLVFRLERAMMRGALSRFAVIALMVLIVSLGGGLLIRLVAPEFESTGDAVWWAILRLTDPGYLGEDAGAVKRTVSAVMTLLGFILFTGSLIAILTQWLVETMQRLELGLTPVALKEHFVVLGWTSRTPTILEEIMASQGRVAGVTRARRWLFGANTPWKRVKLVRGLGTNAASRAMKSNGSKITWVVPSRYGVFSS